MDKSGCGMQMTLLCKVQLGGHFPLFCLSARTTTAEKFLLLFSQLFNAQGARESILKLHNVSLE